MNATETWDVLIRRYLVKNDEADSAAARTVAPDKTVRALLNAHQRRDSGAIQPHIRVIIDRHGRESVVGKTAILLFHDIAAMNVFSNLERLTGTAQEIKSQANAEHIQRVVQIGLSAGEEALRFSESMPDFACAGFYAFQIASALQSIRTRSEAVNTYLLALSHFRAANLAPLTIGQFRVEIAMIQSNLGNLFCEMRELSYAKTACKAACYLFKSLNLEPATRGQFLDHVAVTQLNLGNILRDMDEKTQAKIAYEEAYVLFESLNLKSKPQGQLRAKMAMTQLGLGNVLRDMEKSPQAKIAYEKAYVLFESLNLESRPSGQFRAEIAMVQSNLGALLVDMGKLPQAKIAYNESLRIRRQLNVEPKTFGRFRFDIAATLNNLGILLGNMGERSQAKIAFEEALRLRTELQDFQGMAETYAGLAFLASEENAEEKEVYRLYDRAVSSCEKGLNLVQDTEFRNTFKNRTSNAYHWLIAYYARRWKSGEITPLVQSRLIDLLESLRHVETLAGFSLNPEDSDASTRDALRAAILDGGHLRIYLRERGAAFLWVHHTNQGVVFAAQTPETFLVEIAETGSWEKLFEVQRALHQAIGLWDGTRKNHRTDEEYAHCG